MLRARVGLIAGLIPIGGLLAQAPASRPSAPAELTAARALLERLGEQARNTRTLRARCVQERSSALRKTPLVSRGTLLYRRDPACLVFEFTTPRPSRIRMDLRGYEVYRPEERRLERFVLERDDLPRALFQAFTPDLRQLEARFELTGSERVAVGAGQPPQRLIRLAPKDPAMHAYLRELDLTVNEDASGVATVAYRDGQGDQVVLRLADVERDPKLDGDPFTLVPAPGTQVLVHEERAAPAAPPGSRPGSRPDSQPESRPSTRPQPDGRR